MEPQEQTFRYRLMGLGMRARDEKITARNKTEVRKYIMEDLAGQCPTPRKDYGYVPLKDIKIVWLEN